MQVAAVRKRPAIAQSPASDEDDNEDDIDDEQVEGNIERRDTFINHIDVNDMEYGMLLTMERIEFAVRTLLELMPDRFVPI